MNATLSVLELGFAARLNNDAGYSALSLLRHGWPKTLLEKPIRTALPLTTWFTPNRVQLGNDAPPHLLIQTDQWVWPDDATGGLTQLNAIDAVMLGLLGDEESAATFSYTDEEDAVHWMSCVCLEGSDPPDVLPRRRRLWQVAPA